MSDTITLRMFFGKDGISLWFGRKNDDKWIYKNVVLPLFIIFLMWMVVMLIVTVILMYSLNLLPETTTHIGRLR